MPTHSDGRSSTTLSTTHSNPEACWSSILQPIVLALDRIYDFLDIPKLSPSRRSSMALY